MSNEAQRHEEGGCKEVWLDTFLTWAPAAGEWSVQRPGRFTSEERAAGTHHTGGWWAQEPVWTRRRREKKTKGHSSNCAATYNVELRQLSLFHGIISHVLRH
jgi:hypothetical protein